MLSTGGTKVCVSVVVYTDPAAFGELERDWRQLFERCQANVFLSWEWFSTWWEHFGGVAHPRLLTLWQGSVLVGVVPLMLSRTDDDRCRLALIGADTTTDYADALVEDGWEEALRQQLASYLKDSPEWDEVDLYNLAPDARLLAMASWLEQSPSVVETCPRIALPPTWDEYLAMLDKDDRHELRRKMRRAAEGGELRHRVLTTVAEVEAGLTTFFTLHRRSAAAKQQFLDAPMEAFFRAIARRFAERGWLRLSFLDLDGVPVASTLSFCHGSTVYLYNSGHDPSYRRYSVGIVLVALEIQQAIADGYRCYDFLRGNEPYKYDFGAVDTPLYRILAGRRTDRPAALADCGARGGGLTPPTRGS